MNELAPNTGGRTHRREVCNSLNAGAELIHKP